MSINWNVMREASRASISWQPENLRTDCCHDWLLSIFVSPHSLPRMDFSKGIPSEHRTLIAVPTMLSDEAGIERLLEGLEIRYLANRDANLHFALLTDFADAAEETLATDADRIELARDGIDRLNQKYAEGRSDLFFLLHRAGRRNRFRN